MQFRVKGCVDKRFGKGGHYCISELKNMRKWRMYSCRISCNAVDLCRIFCNAVDLCSISCNAVDLGRISCNAVDLCNISCNAVDLCRISYNFVNLCRSARHSVYLCMSTLIANTLIVTKYTAFTYIPIHRCKAERREYELDDRKMLVRFPICRIHFR